MTYLVNSTKFYIKLAGSIDVPANISVGGLRDEGATPSTPEKRSPTGDEA